MAPEDPRFVEAANATALGDIVLPDPEDVWLSKLRDTTLLVLGVIVHTHGATAAEIRKTTGQWLPGVRLSLHTLKRFELVEREHRAGPDRWYGTPRGTRLGVVPYVTRLLGAAVPFYRLSPGNWSIGRFGSVGTEHGPPVFRPSTALAGVNDPEALAKVIRDGIADDRAYAVAKLIALNDPASVPILAEVARRRGAEEALSRKAVVALGHFPGAASIDVLIEIASTHDSFMREAAARSLGGLHALESVPTLVQLLSFDSAPVRAAAARALGEIGEDSVVADLASLRNDQDRDVRHAARRALKALDAG